jgi:hypothetical protein
MTGIEIFAVMFLAFMFIVLPFAAAWEYGGRDATANWLVKFIESRIIKGEDI